MMPHMLPTYGLLLARCLLALIFLLNAVGMIDQSKPAQEMMERGVPALISPCSWGRGGCCNALPVWLLCEVSGNALLRSPSSSSSCQPHGLLTRCGWTTPRRDHSNWFTL